MGDSSQQTSKFAVLQKAIPAEFKDKLLGCVVNDIVNPGSAFLPDFELGDDVDDQPVLMAERDKLKLTMEKFLIKSETDGRYKNEVQFQDLRTERQDQGDIKAAANLSRLLQTHYSSKVARKLEIAAASGKRYHLHNAANVFEQKLWSNKYYRYCIEKTIKQQRQKGHLKTIAKNHNDYGCNKSTHKCDVVLLPLVVGVVTCDVVQVNFLDSKGKEVGLDAQIPVDKAAGIETGGVFDVGAKIEGSSSKSSAAHETLTSEVIIALAYDLIAVATGNDPDESKTGGGPRSSKRSLFSFFGPNQNFVCPECARKQTAYDEAWVHAEVFVMNGLHINMHRRDNGDDSDSDDGPVPSNTPPTHERAAAPIEYYTKDSNQTVLYENVFQGISPSSTWGSDRSGDSRTEQSIDTVVQQLHELNVRTT